MVVAAKSEAISCDSGSEDAPAFAYAQKPSIRRSDHRLSCTLRSDLPPPSEDGRQKVRVRPGLSNWNLEPTTLHDLWVGSKGTPLVRLGTGDGQERMRCFSSRQYQAHGITCQGLPLRRTHTIIARLSVAAYFPLFS